MQAVQEKNGNVTFILEGDDADMLSRFGDQAARNIDHEVLSSMLDHFGFLGNATYLPIMPVDVGALTDAPMFTDELIVQDDGARDVKGDVWFYADYQLKYFGEVLRDEGKVTFTKVTH